VLYFKLKSQYTPISLKVKHSDNLTQSITYTSTKATRLQTININLALAFGHMGLELASDVKDEELLLLIEHHKHFQCHKHFQLLYTTMRDIYNFNHIDQTLSKETVVILKKLSAYYHKKHYGYENSTVTISGET